MKAEFTAIIEPAPKGGYWAVCPEVPGAGTMSFCFQDSVANLVTGN